MKNIIYVLLGLTLFSCQTTEEKSNEKAQENPTDSTEVNEEVVDEKVAEIPSYDPVYDILFKHCFSPELMKTQNDAIKYLTENGLEYIEMFNPEESRYTLMVELYSENKQNKIEMNYVYDESTEKFISFRNISSKIEDANREGVVAKATQLMNEYTGITPKKYKRHYGEEGLVWEDEKSEKPHQYFIIIKGGNTDWIEVNHYDYWYVNKDEIIP